MKIIKGYVETNKIGSRCEFEIEVEDDATEEEVDEIARDQMFECFEWGYEIEEQPK